MSDNLNNEIKKPLFYDGSLTITTSGGDITPTIIQTAQTTGLEKYNLDQRDQLSIILYALSGTVTAGAILTVKYYNRVPNAIADSILLATEIKTLTAITSGNYLSSDFVNAALELADYFTIECTLKQAVGTTYEITGNVIVKKKIDESYKLLAGGIENGVIYLDGNRIDSYIEDGSILTPFKTPSSLITALNTDYASLSDKQLSTYNIQVAKGTYDWTGLTIPTYKCLKFSGVGVVFSGNATIAQSPIGGSGEQPYTRIEFCGMSGYRAEKGQEFQISGNWTFTRTNDSLTYLTFCGCRVSGNWLFDVDGTFVVQNVNSRISGTISTGTFTDPDSAVLLESSNYARFSGTISGKVSLYNNDLTEFSGNINITPIFDCRITNCKFSNTSNSIIASKNLYIDDNSLKSLTSTTETLTGITVISLDTFTTAPTNAVAADVGVMTITSRPDDYVKNVQADAAFSVASQPNINVQSTGTITVSGTPTAANTFQVFTQVFTYVAAYTEPRVAGEVLIDANTSTMATNIAYAITTDLSTDDVIAVANTNIVNITAGSDVTHKGTGGDAIVFNEIDNDAATAYAPAGGTLGGGVDADTITFGAVTWTFIPNASIPGVLEINIGTNTEGTADNIVSIVNASLIPSFTLDNVTTTITMTATAPGTSGNGVPYNSDGTRITNEGGAKVTSGGVDEVKSYLTIADIDYIFSSTTGDDPSADYPSAYDVRTAAAATMEQIAAALVVGLEADTASFNASDVSNTGAVITALYKTKGIVGNAVTCENHLVVAGDITSARFTAGLMSDGIDGTPGYLGQQINDGDYIWQCGTTDYSPSQSDWHKLASVDENNTYTAINAFDAGLSSIGIYNSSYIKYLVREITDNATALVTDSNVVATISANKTYTLPTPSATEFDNHHIEVVNDLTSTAMLSVGSLTTLDYGDVALIRYKPSVGWKLRKVIRTIKTTQSTPITETRASATYTGASNAGFTLYSKLLGVLGNGATGGITYTIATAGDDNLAISVTGNAITINLANTTSAKNTATLVKAAIEAKAEATALVAIVLTGTGAGVVATQAVANLSGGLNGTAGYRGQVIYDTNNVEWKMIYGTASCYYWTPVDSFPVDNTEYVKSYEQGKLMYKYRHSANTASTPMTVNIPIPLVSKVFTWSGIIDNSSSVFTFLPSGISSALSNINGTTIANDGVKITATISHGAGASKPFRIELTYQK